MVRTYRPTKRGPQKMWEPDSMRRAVAAIKSGEVKSLRLASKLFEVPKTTLARRLKKLANVDAPSAHKATALTTDEEDQLSQWYLHVVGLDQEGNTAVWDHPQSLSVKQQVPLQFLFV